MENFRLKVFRTVADEHSFRRAAEILHLSQPAVSQQIQALETELDVSLFDRARGRVALTAAGTALLAYAKRGAQLAEEAMRAVQQTKGQIAGELRIGASMTVAQYILPRMLGAFLAAHPRVRLAVHSGNSEQIVESLAGKQIDLGLIEGPVSSREVFRQRFFEDRLVLIVGRNSKWAEKPSLPLHALAQLPMLMRERGSGTRRVVEAALRRAGVSRRELEVVLELDSIVAIISAVEVGIGASFISEWAVRKELRLGTIRVLDVPGLDIRRDMTLVRHPGPPQDPVATFERFVLGGNSVWTR